MRSAEELFEELSQSDLAESLVIIQLTNFVRNNKEIHEGYPNVVTEEEWLEIKDKVMFTLECFTAPDEFKKIKEELLDE